MRGRGLTEKRENQSIRGGKKILNRKKNNPTQLEGGEGEREENTQREETNR